MDTIVNFRQKYIYGLKEELVYNTFHYYYTKEPEIRIFTNLTFVFHEYLDYFNNFVLEKLYIIEL